MAVKVPFVWSPMPTGSGAIEVHKHLAERLSDYELRPFDPRLELFPPLLCSLRNPDARIVHATPDHGAMVVSRGQELVVTFHNFVLDGDESMGKGLLRKLHYHTDLRWLSTAALHRAAIITAVSDFTARLVEDFFDLQRPVQVIPNGIDTALFSPATHDDRRNGVRVIVSGNASMRKGTHRIAAIAARLDPSIQILCTISESERIRWIGDIPNVHALGQQPPERMPSVYRDADILLMPTAREGFGLAVAEAMATGLPVVSSDRSTMPELVRDGMGGFVCPLDSPAVFADRINRLARDIEMRNRMGAFNRREAERRFGLARMVDSYAALFAELAEEALRSKRIMR